MTPFLILVESKINNLEKHITIAINVSVINPCCRRFFVAFMRVCICTNASFTCYILSGGVRFFFLYLTFTFNFIAFFVCLSVFKSHTE